LVGEPSYAGGIGNSRFDLGAAFGPPLGETPGRLVIFRQPGREYHVAFTPEPERAVLLVETPVGARLTLDIAVRESRRFLPLDAQPLSPAPEGNGEFVVERFSSVSLAQALGSGDVSIVYTRDSRGGIGSIVLGLGLDYPALIEQSRH
jgi:hypothetical protein